MVEKRALVFIALAVVVWATLASVFAGYYYLQSRNYGEQLSQTQDSLNTLASNYDDAVKKYTVLLSAYSELYGNYSSSMDGNYAGFIGSFGNLVANLSRDYTYLLSRREDLNRTYSQLLNHYEMLKQKDSVTREEFGDLLSEYYRVFQLLSLNQLTLSVRETVVLSVSVVIDYGNGTLIWHNDTEMSAGSSLFELTRKIAAVNHTYYALIEPGHVLINSINDKASYIDPSYTWGYSWIWYYWDDAQKKWISGPVGSDAWLLEDGGVYKWNYEYWSWP